MLKAAAFIVPLCLSLLVACGSPTPPTPALTPDRAYGAEAPALAQTITPEEFQRRLDAGELTLTRADDAAARRAASQQQAQDLASLGALTDRSEVLNAFLTGQTDAQPNANGDLVVRQTGTDGKVRSFMTLGVGAVARGLVGAEQASRDPANALEVYRAAYRLLAPAQAATLPTPDSLSGKSITELRAAISSLDDAQGEVPDLDRVRSEVPGAIAGQGLKAQSIGISDGQQPGAGNGTDNSGVCAAPSPDGLLGRLRWPLKTFVSPTKNQGERGTCWAFSSVGALESRALVTDGTSVDLSEQHFNNLRKLSSQSPRSAGDWPREALNDLAGRGSRLAPESAWTYNPYPSCDSPLVYTGLCSNTLPQNPLTCTVSNGVTFCGFEPVVYTGGLSQPVVTSTLVWDNLHSQSRLPLNVIRTLLADGGELILSFRVTPGFAELGRGGYLTAAQDDGRRYFIGLHAVQVTGFIPDSLAPFAPEVVGGTGGGWFVVKNSWGCTWGDAGYGYLPVRFVQLNGLELDALSMPSTRSAAFIAVRDALKASNPPTPVVTGVSVSGGPLELYPGQSADFRALVSGTGAIDPNVEWTLNPDYGTLSSSRGTTVRYTAPTRVDSEQRVTLTAAAVSDQSQSTSVDINLLPPLGGTLKFSAVSSDAGSFTTFAPNTPTPVLNRITVTAALKAGTSSIARVEFTRGGVPLQSLTLSPPLAAYQSGDATLTGDLTGLAPGPQTLILLAYDQAGNEVARTGLAVTVPVTQPIIGPPSPGSLNLSATVGGTATATISFTNTGNAPLTADLTPAASWLSVLSRTPNPLAPGQTATVTVQATCPATPQTLNSSLGITDRENLSPSVATVEVSLSCLALPLPSIGDPTPAALNLSAAPGATASGSFTYTNTGAAPLSADIRPGSNSGWLTVLSNAPNPLAPGQTATVTLTATCPATPQTLSTSLTITANNSGVPEKTVTVSLSCQQPSLPIIGDPTPAVLNLSGAVGTQAIGSFTFTNTGFAPLSAEAKPGLLDSELEVISNTPSPLAPGQTATVTVRGTCQAAGISYVDAQIILTANDSRVPDKRVTVNLTCGNDLPLQIRAYAVSTQNVGVPAFPPKTNPTVVLGKVTFYGDIQASAAAAVESVKLITNGTVLSQNTVSVPAGSLSAFSFKLLDLDTTALPNGLYTVTMRAEDSKGAFSDTAPFVIRVKNGGELGPASEIYTVNGVSVGPGQPPVTLKKSFYNYDVNVFGGSTGYSGSLYTCLERAGRRILLGQIPFDSRFAAYPVPVNGVSPLEIGSNSDQIAVTDTTNGNYDTLFISGNSACDVGPNSNLPTTSVIRVIFTN